MTTLHFRFICPHSISLLYSKPLSQHILLHIRNNKHETENASQAPFHRDNKESLLFITFFPRWTTCHRFEPLRFWQVIDHILVTGACEEKLHLDLFSVNYPIGSHFKDAKLPRQDFCWVVYLRNRGMARTSQSWGKKCLRADAPCRYSFDCKWRSHETWISCEWSAQGSFLRVFSVLWKPKQIFM